MRKSGERRVLRVFLMARYALLRKKEIFQLRLSDIDDTHIHVRRDPSTGRTPNHNDNERSVKISRKLKDFFHEEGIYEERKTNPSGFYSSIRHPQTVYAKLKPLKPTNSGDLAVLHGIRSAGITKLLLETNQPELVAKYAGHTPKVMYQHYISLKGVNTDSLADIL